MKKLKLFVCGVAVGLTTVTLFASVPRHSQVTDDTVIYQKLSEIRVSREAELNFDGDLHRLSAIEGRYNEKLPALKNPRVRAPMQRIAAQKYRYSGNRPSVVQD